MPCCPPDGPFAFTFSSPITYSSFMLPECNAADVRQGCPYTSLSISTGCKLSMMQWRCHTPKEPVVAQKFKSPSFWVLKIKMAISISHRQSLTGNDRCPDRKSNTSCLTHSIAFQSDMQSWKRCALKVAILLLENACSALLDDNTITSAVTAQICA